MLAPSLFSYQWRLTNSAPVDFFYIDTQMSRAWNQHDSYFIITYGMILMSIHGNLVSQSLLRVLVPHFCRLLSSSTESEKGRAFREYSSCFSEYLAFLLSIYGVLHG